MIGKLRLRFILLAMLSMILVLTVIIGGINIFNYLNVSSEADRMLYDLSENGGRFTMPEKPEEPMPFSDNNGRREMDNRFSARYFSVTVDSSGQIIKIDTESIYAIDETTAEEYAKEILKSKKTAGFKDIYRFLVTDTEDGRKIIFYDCGRSINNFRNFRNISVLISICGLGIVFLLIYFLSGIIVKPAKESYEKQKRFITDAGHEIKTPLAIINADADVLAMDVGEDNEWSSDIKLQVKRLTKLTDDLIYLSKMEEDKKPSKTVFDMSKDTSETAESFKSRAISMGLRYEISIDPDIKINGDQNSLGKLPSILLDNAMKYTPEGGTVEVSLKLSGKKAILTVTNDTSGELSEEECESLFDRFYRSDRSRNSQTGGHGLGLSIARAIVTSHSGTINAALAGKKLAITASIPV